MYKADAKEKVVIFSPYPWFLRGQLLKKSVRSRTGTADSPWSREWNKSPLTSCDPKEIHLEVILTLFSFPTNKEVRSILPLIRQSQSLMFWRTRPSFKT